MYQPRKRLVLVRWDTIAKDLVIAHGVTASACRRVAGVAHHGVDETALALLHDVNMVCSHIKAVASPFEIDDVTGVRLISQT